MSAGEAKLADVVGEGIYTTITDGAGSRWLVSPNGTWIAAFAEAFIISDAEILKLLERLSTAPREASHG